MSGVPVHAVFLGLAESGPYLRPIAVTGWREFELIFGAHPAALLTHSVQGWFQNGGGTCAVVRLGVETGDDPLSVLLAALEDISTVEDVDLVAFPDLASLTSTGRGAGVDLDRWTGQQSALIAACEEAGDRIAVLDAPPGLLPEDLREWRLNHANYDTPYAVLYWPWIRVSRNAGMATVPPSGHIAGTFAASARRDGLLRAPANMRLEGALDVEWPASRAERELMTGINPIRALSRWGIRAWNARTLASDPAVRDVGRVRLLARICQELNAAPGHDASSVLKQTWGSAAPGVACPAPCEINETELVLPLDEEIVARFIRLKERWRWQVLEAGS